MNCSFWASAGAAAPAARAKARAPNINAGLIANLLFVSTSMREGPETQFLLADLPQPGQAVGLDGEEEEDQGTEDHQLEVRGKGLADTAAKKRVGGDVQQDRQQHDEPGAEEGPQDASHPADDYHEEDLEGAVQVEGLRLDRAQVREGPQRPGDAAVEGADAEGEELGLQHRDPDDLRGDVHVADRHPRAAQAAPHEVLGGQSEERHDRRGQHVAPDGRLEADAENDDLLRVDDSRGTVVGEPGELRQRPLDDELSRERRDGQVEALDPEAREPEENAN